MRMLDMAHKEHGKLGWEKLFDEGIQLATNGYRIPGRMGDAIKGNAASLALDANAVSAFFNTDGTPKATGRLETFADEFTAILQRQIDERVAHRGQHEMAA